LGKAATNRECAKVESTSNIEQFTAIQISKPPEQEKKAALLQEIKHNGIEKSALRTDETENADTIH
jgi:hypothetical protein